MESDDESSDTIGPPSDQSDTDDEDDKEQKASNLTSIHAAQSLSSNNSIRFESSLNEDQCSPLRQQSHVGLEDLQTRQLNSSNLYNLSKLSAESECNLLPLSCPTQEHTKWQEHESKDPEVEVKKEFDDLVKLRADQKKNMQRAKDLLKAAFSESESETEESEGEDENELSKLIDVVDTDMT